MDSYIMGIITGIDLWCFGDVLVWWFWWCTIMTPMQWWYEMGILTGTLINVDVWIYSHSQCDWRGLDWSSQEKPGDIAKTSGDITRYNRICIVCIYIHIQYTSPTLAMVICGYITNWASQWYASWWMMVSIVNIPKWYYLRLVNRTFQNNSQVINIPK